VCQQLCWVCQRRHAYVWVLCLRLWQRVWSAGLNWCACVKAPSGAFGIHSQAMHGWYAFLCLVVGGGKGVAWKGLPPSTWWLPTSKHSSALRGTGGPNVWSCLQLLATRIHGNRGTLGCTWGADSKLCPLLPCGWSVGVIELAYWHASAAGRLPLDAVNTRQAGCASCTFLQ
jgi:hypothetical protein